MDHDALRAIVGERAARHLVNSLITDDALFEHFHYLSRKEKQTKRAQGIKAYLTQRGFLDDMYDKTGVPNQREQGRYGHQKIDHSLLYTFTGSRSLHTKLINSIDAECDVDLSSCTNDDAVDAYERTLQRLRTDAPKHHSFRTLEKYLQHTGRITYDWHCRLIPGGEDPATEPVAHGELVLKGAPDVTRLVYIYGRGTSTFGCKRSEDAHVLFVSDRRPPTIERVPISNIADLAATYY